MSVGSSLQNAGVRVLLFLGEGKDQADEEHVLHRNLQLSTHSCLLSSNLPNTFPPGTALQLLHQEQRRWEISVGDSRGSSLCMSRGERDQLHWVSRIQLSMARGCRRCEAGNHILKGVGPQGVPSCCNLNR